MVKRRMSNVIMATPPTNASAPIATNTSDPKRKPVRRKIPAMTVTPIERKRSVCTWLR